MSTINTIGQLVAQLLVSPIDRDASSPSIQFGGSANNSSGTGLYGSYGRINLAINAADIFLIDPNGLSYNGGIYSGQGHSFQPVNIDLELAATAGSNDGSNPKFLAPMMGNLHGSAIVRQGNYLAGMIGAMDASATSDYPVGPLMGIAMDGASGMDGVVVGVIDGNDPSGVVLPNAVFKVRQNNNNAGSGANYGLDLYDPGNSHYTGGPVPFSVKKADIRMSNQQVIMTGAGVPTNGTTGDNFAGTGSLYIDTTAGKLWINTGVITNPTWVVVGSQS